MIQPHHKPTAPRDPNEMLMGTCATCKQPAEIKRADLPFRPKSAHWSDAPACECKGCGAVVYLTVKPPLEEYKDDCGS